MPNVFRPALAAARARGLRVVQGGGNAARMRALVRRARATGAGTEAERAAVERAAGRAAPRPVELDVLGPEGYERTVRRAPAARYSPEATAAQSMRTEALQRHAGPSPSTEDPRMWAGMAGAQAKMLQSKGGMMASMPLAQARLMRNFERKYGWRPASADEAVRMLDEEALSDLLDPTKWPD